MIADGAGCPAAPGCRSGFGRAHPWADPATVVERCRDDPRPADASRRLARPSKRVLFMQDDRDFERMIAAAMVGIDGYPPKPTTADGFESAQQLAPGVDESRDAIATTALNAIQRAARHPARGAPDGPRPRASASPNAWPRPIGDQSATPDPPRKQRLAQAPPPETYGRRCRRPRAPRGRHRPWGQSGRWDSLIVPRFPAGGCASGPAPCPHAQAERQHRRTAIGNERQASCPWPAADAATIPYGSEPEGRIA